MLNKLILLKNFLLVFILIGCDSSNDSTTEMSTNNNSYSFKKIIVSDVAYYSSGSLLRTSLLTDSIFSLISNDINFSYKFITNITIEGDSFHLVGPSLKTDLIQAGLITKLNDGFEF